MGKSRTYRTASVIALAAGLGRPWSGPAELIGLNGIFILLFGVAAWLFRRAGQA